MKDYAELTPTLRRNIGLNVRHGIANILAVNLTTPFFGILALKLGASNFQVGLLSSAPAVVALFFMLPGAILVDRSSRKKRATTLFFLANRLFYLVLALVPLLADDWRVWALVLTVAIMNLPGAIGNVAWQGFIARVIPPSERAQAFARRNKWMNIVGTAAVVVAGRALDMIAFPYGYVVVFGLAFVAAMVEIRIFQEIEEPAAEAATPRGAESSSAAKEPPEAKRGSWGSRLGAWARDNKRFVRYTVASIVFYLGWQIAWPLFTLYQVNVLGANNLWVSLLTLCNTGGAILGYGFWAAFADRHGHLRTLFVSTMGIFIVPLYYALSRSLIVITVLNLATGAIFSGVNLSLFNALLEQTPDRHKTTFIAGYNTAVTFTTAVAPLLGVGLLNYMNFFWAFLLCTASRIIGSLCFLAVERIEARQARSQAETSGGVAV